MPNTLAHIGVQTFLQKGKGNYYLAKWIMLGAILPDIPWIIQRIVKTLPVDVNLYDLRLYAIIQASFFFTLFLAFAFSAFSGERKKVLFTMVTASLFHLLLDATQYKWGNGVHLFVPFSWELVNFGFYWPTDLLNHLFSALGVFVAFYFLFAKPGMFDLKIPSQKELAASVLFLLIYLILPLFLINFPLNADNHYIKTITEKDSRAGKYVEFDRADYFRDGNYITNFAKERFELAGPLNLPDSKLSIRGEFTGDGKLKILEYHLNSQYLRDFESILGLFLILLIWLKSIFTYKRSEP